MYGNDRKKLLILLILEVLQQYTDEEHHLSQQEILRILKRDYDITCDRRSVRSNVLDLIDLGYDICMDDGYYFASRDFENAELRMLIDSVLFSRHISPTQGKRLIDKLQDLGNKYFKPKVSHVIALPDLNHTDNKQVMIVVDTLNDAIEEKKIKLRNQNISEGKKILNLLNSGIILSDGSCREFDIIDYYMNTKIPPKMLVYILRKYSDLDNFLSLKKFAARHDNDFMLKESDIEHRLSDRIFFNCLIDEDGKLIENSGFEISDSDKMFVFEYLQENNVPITECTYSAGLKRIKNGYFVQKEKQLVLK